MASKPHPASEHSSSEYEEEEEPQQPTPKPTATTASTPHKQPPSNDDDAEYEDSDEEEEPTPPPPVKPKPSSSASTTKKRPAESDPSRNDKKKKKKKNMFVRIWTEEDEIVILKGVINFKKKGMDTTSHASAFFDFIKDRLSSKDVYQSQLQSKIRALKRKFLIAVEKQKPVEKLTTHDAELYRLSRKIWSEEEEEKKSKSNVASGAASTNPRVTTLPNNTIPKARKQGVKDDDEKRSSTEYLYLTASSNASNFPVMPLWLGDVVSNKGWEMIGSTKAQNFDQRWKDLIISETKVYLQRLDMVKEQTRAMLDALDG